MRLVECPRLSERLIIWLPWVMILGLLTLVAKGVVRTSQFKAKIYTSRLKWNHKVFYEAVLVIQTIQLWDAIVDLVYPSRAHYHWILLAHSCLFSDTPSLLLTWLVPYVAVAGLSAFVILLAPFSKTAQSNAEKDPETTAQQENKVKRTDVFLRELVCSVVLFEACFQIWLLRSVARGLECATWSVGRGEAWDPTCGDAVMWVPMTIVAFVLNNVLPLVGLSYLSRVQKGSKTSSTLLQCAACAVPHVSWWTCRLLSNLAVVFLLAISSFIGPNGPQKHGLIWTQGVILVELMIFLRILRWDRGWAVSVETILRVTLLVGMQVLSRAPPEIGPWSAPLIALIIFVVWGLYTLLQHSIFVRRVKHGRVKVQHMAQQLSQMALYLIAVERKEFGDFCVALSPEERWRVQVASNLVTSRLLSAESKKESACGNSRRGSMDSLSEQFAVQASSELVCGVSNSSVVTGGTNNSTHSSSGKRSTHSNPREAEDWVPPLPALDGQCGESKDEDSMKKWVLDHLVPASANPNDAQRPRDVDCMPLGASATSPWMSPRGSTENVIKNPPRLSAENLIRSPHQSAEHILKAPPALLFADIARRQAFSEQQIVKAPKTTGSGGRHAFGTTHGDSQASKRHTMAACISGPAPPSFVFSPGTVFSPSDLVTIVSASSSKEHGKDSNKSPSSKNSKESNGLSSFLSDPSSPDSGIVSNEFLAKTPEKSKGSSGRETKMTSEHTGVDATSSPTHANQSKCEPTLVTERNLKLRDKMFPRRRSAGQALDVNSGSSRALQEIYHTTSAPERLGENVSGVMGFGSLFSMVVAQDASCREQAIDWSSMQSDDDLSSMRRPAFDARDCRSDSNPMQRVSNFNFVNAMPCASESEVQRTPQSSSAPESEDQRTPQGSGSEIKSFAGISPVSGDDSSTPAAGDLRSKPEQSQSQNSEKALSPQTQNIAQKVDENAQKKADWEKWNKRKAEKEAKRKKKMEAQKKRERHDSQDSGMSSSLSSVCSAASKFSSLSMASQLSGPPQHYSHRISQHSRNHLWDDPEEGVPKAFSGLSLNSRTSGHLSSDSSSRAPESSLTTKDKKEAVEKQEGAASTLDSLVSSSRSDIFKQRDESSVYRRWS